ncbi:MAG: phosphoribosyl transferase [Gemmatimonadetes bacterium]|jgi:putative phosphoribosyl transferase|nr:phosphoribosyl transferase [Gemmatimonadota bacterium]
MLFRDRAEAGNFLSRELLDAVPELHAEPVTVLAIPRGGVPVAAPIATMLQAPLDVFIARKLGAPGHEELAIGAVAADGTRVLDHQLVRVLRVSDSYIEKITEREIAEARRRLALFRGTRPPPPVRDRAVILVDDGLATGATARAALTVLLAEKPLRLIFAAPVASQEGAEAVASLGVITVFSAIPKHFQGVGEWYEEFEQTTDEEVLALLSAVNDR